MQDNIIEIPVQHLTKPQQYTRDIANLGLGCSFSKPMGEYSLLRLMANDYNHANTKNRVAVMLCGKQVVVKRFK